MVVQSKAPRRARDRAAPGRQAPAAVQARCDSGRWRGALEPASRRQRLIGAIADGRRAAGATSAAVTGTSGARRGAGAGADCDGRRSGWRFCRRRRRLSGAVATAGCACVVSDGAAAGGAPGTPPVTLIESSPESSLLAACGADAGARRGIRSRCVANRIARIRPPHRRADAILRPRRRRKRECDNRSRDDSRRAINFAWFFHCLSSA